MDDTNVNEAEEFAREISKELASYISNIYGLDSEEHSDLDKIIFEYFKERNENRGRG